MPTWAQVDPKLGPKLSQVGLKIGVQLHSNFELILEWILEPLGVDFGRLLGSKMVSKSGLKIRCVKTQKFEFRVDGSVVFEVPRVSKID